MSTTQIVTILVISVGLLIIGATVVSALKSGSAPFGFEATKDGVKVQTTFVGASLLAGLVIFLGAGYFFNNNYEKQVEDLQKKYDKQVDDLTNKAANLSEVIEKSRGVDLNARLQFPDADSANNAKSVQIVINRDAAILVQTLQMNEGFLSGERSVLIPGLHSGDEIAIHAESADKKYHNKQSIRIPNSLIEMIAD